MYFFLFFMGMKAISLEQALNIFHCFSFCTGLRVNLDKTEAIWVGSRLGSDKQLLPVKHENLHQK
jgi:hypothetical protein